MNKIDSNLIGGILGLFGAAVGFLIFMMLPTWIGWKNLAEKYPIRVPYTGNWQRWKSGKVNFFNMTWGLKIATTTEYLYLAPEDYLLYWRSQLPSLQIPWTSISSAENKGRWLVLHIDGVAIALPEQSIPSTAVTQIGAR